MNQFASESGLGLGLDLEGGAKNKQKQKQKQKAQPQAPSTAVNLLQCNPKTLQHTKTTCLPLESLIHLRDKWNELYPKHMIPTTVKSKDELWSLLRDRLKNQYKCDTEYCAVEELGLGLNEGNTTIQQYFRPKKPASWLKKPNEWHDSVSLANVMEQYEAAHPSFEFIGPVPIDFDKKPDGLGSCIVNELCALNLEDLKRKGKTSIGIIFNLDPHDKPGSHWVCAFIDLKQGAAFYFDSYGMKPEPQIKRLLERCYEQGCHSIVWNDYRHQRKSSECGTYCLYVLTSLLNNRDFGDICKNIVDDDTMLSVRDLLFANRNPSVLARTKGVMVLSE